MTPSNELFELIKSLNKTEKRYIKLNFSPNEDAKYRMLFDEIDKQGTYDENKIKEKFKSEKFIKQLTFTKHYLYNIILNLLISYNRANSTETQMTELVIKLRILFRKGLFVQYFKTLLKYKAKAAEYEKHYILIELIRMQRLVMEARKFRSANSADIYAEEKDILQKIENIGEYSKLFNKAMALKRKSGITGKQTASKAAGELLNNELLRNIKLAYSTQAKEYFYHIKQQLYAIKGDKNNQYKSCIKRLKCIENNPKPFLDDIINTRREALFTLADLSIDRKNGEHKIFLEKYFSSKQGKKIKSALISNFIELKYHVNINDFSIDKVCFELEDDLKRYRGKLDKDMEIEAMFLISKYYFYKTEFSAALKKNNDILSLPTAKFRKDIYTYSRILEIMIHFELENYVQVEYLVDSLRKLLGKEKELNYNELNQIDLIGKILPPRNIDRTSLLKAIQSEKSAEGNNSQYLDTLSWINSKISKL